MNSKKSGAVANDPPGSEGLVLTNKVYANDTYFCLNRSLSLKQDTLKEHNIKDDSDLRVGRRTVIACRLDDGFRRLVRRSQTRRQCLRASWDRRLLKPNAFC